MIIDPMKATLLLPGEKIPNWPTEDKVDGIRCMLYLNPTGNAALTRVKGKHTDTYADKSEHLSWLRKLTHWMPVVLDGELQYGANSRETMEIFGSLPERALRLQAETFPAIFIAYDVPFHGKSLCHLMPWVARMQILATVLQKLDSPYLLKVRSGVKLDQCKEGIMLKDPHGKYEPGKRSRSWLKLKHERRFHVAVLRATAGKPGKTGQMVGLMGALEVAVWKDGSLHSIGKVGTGFDMAEREQAFGLREVIEVTCAELTDDGKLWHGRFIRRVPEKDFKETGEVKDA